jgi:hypothetical protein
MKFQIKQLWNLIEWTLIDWNLIECQQMCEENKGRHQEINCMQHLANIVRFVSAKYIF